MQTKLSIILDTLFLSTISFFITLAFVGSFIESQLTCFIIATIVFCLCVGLIFPKSLKSFNLKYVKLSEKKHMENCIFNLQTMEKEMFLQFFTDLFTKNYKVEKYNNSLILDSKVIVCFESISPLSDKRFILDCYIQANKKGLKEIAVFTETKDINIESYAQNLPSIDIYFFDNQSTYMLMKTYQTFPTELKEVEKQRSFAGLKNISLNKKKARSFLFTSFLLYFSSLFIPFTKYYLFFAALALLLSIICFCKSMPKIESKQSYLLIKKD